MGRGSLTAAIAACLLACTPLAFAQTEGRSTLEVTVNGGDRSSGTFQRLGTGPGEPHFVRAELAAPQSGRDARRVSLGYFGQLSDFQLADEESPARVELFDPFADPGTPASAVNAAWRPHEALVPQAVDSAIRNLNKFVHASPVAQGNGRRAKMAFALLSGDLADSQQRNETLWVRTLLEGGRLTPNSGTANAPCGATAQEAAGYTGIQEAPIALAGGAFYNPNQPGGRYATWPRHPGLLDRAQAPFKADGLKVPSYVAMGNHDGLVQGNVAANALYEQIATGCVKPLVGLNPLRPQDFDPGAALSGDPDAVLLVPPDPDRQFVNRSQYRAIFAAGKQADAHGFAHVDDDELTASGGDAAYYAWDPLPGFRFIALDTVSVAGFFPQSAEGNIDAPQFSWLERELIAAEQAGKLVVVFGHHPIRSLTSSLADERAPPCSIQDSHGHDINAGCDEDPRSSEPIRLGGDLQTLLLAHPRAIAYVAGHTHEARITPFERTNGSGGFWGIETPSIADWQPQSRLLEVMDNDDGTLSIFGTLVDTAAPITPPAPGTGAGAFSTEDLASIARTLTYNDPQAGGGTGEGRPPDRNVELLLPDPRRRR